MTTVAFVELAGSARSREGAMQHCQCVGLMGLRMCGWIVVAQLDLPSEPPRALEEQITVGQADQLTRIGLSGYRQAQLGADAGRFARG